MGNIYFSRMLTFGKPLLWPPVFLGFSLISCAPNNEWRYCSSNNSHSIRVSSDKEHFTIAEGEGGGFNEDNYFPIRRCWPNISLKYCSNGALLFVNPYVVSKKAVPFQMTIKRTRPSSFRIRAYDIDASSTYDIDSDGNVSNLIVKYQGFVSERLHSC
jgi:hypothetical protein